MKKVWILEKFESNEMMVKTLGELEQMFEENKGNFDEKDIESMNQTIASYKKRIEENPEGMWIGWEGKTIYRQFCDVAKAALRRADKSWKFRVVEGEIEDNAQCWCGYKFVKENEGVLRYLMATK
jgi:hypothetical protein